MTLNEVYVKGKQILIDSNVENAAFDSMCIFKLCFNLNRQDIVLYKNKLADNVLIQKFFELINQRKDGVPLQYILGKWEFMDFTFEVGHGVLIPRDDTEVLVRESLNLIEKVKTPKILDLCSGSGAIAISLAKKRPDSNVIAVELSNNAIYYLNKNVKLNCADNVKVKRLNVLLEPPKDFFNQFDIIVSNPPYIPTKEISNLSKEVQNEPRMALDGGTDGLKFYRSIIKNWRKILKKSGMICLEIGLEQSKFVVNLLKKYNFVDVYCVKDLNCIDRVVAAKLN